MDPTFDSLKDYFTLGAKMVGLLNAKHMKDFHLDKEDKETSKDNYLEKTGRVRCGNTLYKKVEGTDSNVEVYDIEIGRHLEE